MKNSSALKTAYLLVLIMICSVSCKKSDEPNLNSMIVGTWIQYKGALDANHNHYPDPLEFVSYSNGSGETLKLNNDGTGQSISVLGTFNFYWSLVNNSSQIEITIPGDSFKHHESIIKLTSSELTLQSTVGTTDTWAYYSK